MRWVRRRFCVVFPLSRVLLPAPCSRACIQMPSRQVQEEDGTPSPQGSRSKPLGVSRYAPGWHLVAGGHVFPRRHPLASMTQSS